MSRSSLFAVLLSLSAPPAWNNAHAAEKLVDRIEGVYKLRSTHSTIDGGAFQSQDTLELVKLSPSKMYFRLSLHFFNRHYCSLHGVARQASDTTLVYEAYRNPQTAGNNPQCRLTLHAADHTISFSDEDEGCRRNSCSVRGSYTGKSFPLFRRKTIRYMDKVVKSQQYKAALKEYRQLVNSKR